MNLYATSPESLWSSPAFVRFMACSVAAHAVVIFLVAYGPIFRFRSDIPQPVLVNLVDMAALEPAAEVTPPAPEPPKPEPPEVKPPPPEPEPPKQVVEENVVVPDVPPEKPRPPKKKPPPPKPVDVAELMKSVRAEADKNRPPQKNAGAAGVNDPEMAAYNAKVMVCLRQNWVGAQRFQRRRDLVAQFDVQLGPGGKVVSAEITRASGENVFDETAERSIYKCQPWPEPPGGRTLVPVTFVPEEMQ